MDEIREVAPEIYQVIEKVVDEKIKDALPSKKDFVELKDLVKELAQAQARTEQSVEKLAQAQARTEESVAGLRKGFKELARQVGALTHTIGYSIEDIGRVMLPSYLWKHYQINIEDLSRKFLTANGKKVEINLYGERERAGKKVIILCEAKTQIFREHVIEFMENVNEVAHLFAGEEVFKVMFAFLIRPEAMELAAQENISLVASYQR